MSEKTSQRILMGELLVLIFPVFALFMIITTGTILNTIIYPYDQRWPDMIFALLAIVVCVSLISEIILSLQFILDGRRKIQNVKPTLWILSFLGLTIASIGAITYLLPPTEVFTFQNDLRYVFETAFTFSLPMAIPFAHLIYEKKHRSQTTAPTNIK